MAIEISTFLVFMGAPSALTVFCFWFLQRGITKREQLRSEQENTMQKNQLLLIKGLGAALMLGEATAHAIRDGKCNGEMSAALEYSRKTKQEQTDFLLEQGVKNLH